MSEFTPGDLNNLQNLAREVKEVADIADRRLVVEVWDRGDTQPEAWVEYYPGDSDATIRFTRESGA